jgi:2,4-diketo-3-deoxy-L-fuconate hydrolase
MTLGGSGLGAQAQKVVPYADTLGAAWGRGDYPLAL